MHLFLNFNKQGLKVKYNIEIFKLVDTCVFNKQLKFKFQYEIKFEMTKFFCCN